MKMSEILLNMDKVRAQYVCGDLSAVIISLASVRKRNRLRGNSRSQAGLLSHSDSLGNGSSENSPSNPRSTHITAIMIFSAADLDYGTFPMDFWMSLINCLSRGWYASHRVPCAYSNRIASDSLGLLLSPCSWPGLKSLVITMSVTVTVMKCVRILWLHVTRCTWTLTSSTCLLTVWHDTARITYS